MLESRKPGEEAPNRERQILVAAAELFAEQGFKATAMREIADRVGISKPALYHWFPDKDKIYIVLIMRVLEELCVTTEEAIANGSNAEEKFRLFIRAHTQYVHDNLKFYIAANFGFAGLRDSRERLDAIRFRDRHEGNLRGIIDRGVSDGIFAKGDTKMTSRAILSALTGLSRWYRPNGKASIGEIAEAFETLYLDGLRARSS